MDDLGEGFFLVMDPDNNYSLIHVNPKAILQFDESTYCDNLLSLARSVGKSIAEYGVVKVLGEKPHVCKFNDLGSIERAMAALASSRTDTSNGDTVFNLLVISRIYRRS
jgi:phage I-like protein